MHAPHHVPKEWADRYKGAFDGGWEAYRGKVFERQKALGLVPEDAALSRHDPDVHDWETLLGRRATRLRADDGGLRGLPRPTPTTTSASSSSSSKELGEYDNTLIMLISDNGASAEGGPTGSVNECRFFNNVPDDARGEPRGARRARRAEVLQPLSRGAGPTPATRRSGAGSARPTAAVSAIRSSCTGPRASRRAARSAPSTPTSSIWCRPCSTPLGIEPPRVIRGVTQSPIEGVSLPTTFDDADAPSEHVTQYFEMMGHRALYHDGWRAVCPWPGPSFAEAGRGFGAPHHARRSDAARRHGLGALSRDRGLRRDQERRRRSSATG